MSKYLALYVQEAREHLEALGKEFLLFEGDRASARLDEMFRHAHSLKGMSASMGFEQAATVAHRLEDILDALRADVSRATRDVIDQLLGATDALQAQVSAAQAHEPFPDTRAVLDALAQQQRELTGRVPGPTRVAQVDNGRSTEALAPAPTPVSVLPPRWTLRFRIAATCATPGVRAFLLVKRLGTVGNVFDLRPPLPDLQAGRLPNRELQLVLETATARAEIEALVARVSDVEFVSSAPLQSQPPPQVQAAPEASRVVGAQDGGKTLRVRVEVMDAFLDSASELLLAVAQVRDKSRKLLGTDANPLETPIDRLHARVRELHDRVMRARLTPLSLATGRLPQVARDIARKRQREVDVNVSGDDVELDRSVVEQIVEPLIHILRNALDHGLEAPAERARLGKPPAGRVSVRVARVRDRVTVEVEDDGRGLNLARLKEVAVARGVLSRDQAEALSDADAALLCCQPGVSTTQDVTELSGRGVGMDAVKRAVENLGGQLTLETRPGQGTCVRLSLPITAAVVQLLLVGVEDDVVGLPLNRILGVMQGEKEGSDAPVVGFGDALIPVFDLRALLGRAPGARGGDSFVVVDVGAGRCALKVDRLFGQEEVVLKTLARPLDLIPGLAGTTILGSGRPVFILDVPRLVS